MNTSLRAIYTLAFSIMLFISGIAAFNYTIDPQCFFHCNDLDVSRKTVNLYYHVAQRVLAFPETQQVVIGSSRGEGVSGLELEKSTGLKTLNLSVGGSEMTSKLAFLKVAQENLNLKRVIWIADYFELLTDIADPKVLFSNALSSKAPQSLQVNSGWNLKILSKLLDRQTIEASIHQLSHDRIKLDLGPSSTLSYDKCLLPEYKGSISPEILRKEVDLIYNGYLQQIFSSKEHPQAWVEFEKKLNQLSKDGIEVVIVIPPYNPEFQARLKKDRPAIFEKHLEWISKMTVLKINLVSVLNFFTGIPGDDGSPRYWNDGVHFSCLGNAKMLKTAKQN